MFFKSKWNNDKFQCECKKYCTCKKGYSWNPSTCICVNRNHLKSILDGSVIVCNKIVSVKHSTNITNTILINVKSTVSINSNDKNVRYKMNGCILHTSLLVIILLFIITIQNIGQNKKQLAR